MTEASARKPRPRETEASPLGGIVRRLRQGKALTLKQASVRTGLAASTLSKIENGQISPTYDNIVRLAQGLGVEVSALFRPESGSDMLGRRAITRQGEGVAHSTPQYLYEMLCPELSSKRFIPIRATLRAHTQESFGAPIRHRGEEFVFVLSGEVEIQTEHYRPLRLGVGDSCYFDSTMAHALISCGAQDAEILWICSDDVETQNRR